MEELRVTPLSEWAMPTHLLPLPSGRVVRVKSLELQNALAAGRIPNPLLNEVAEIVRGEKRESEKLEEMQKEDPTLLIQFLQWIVQEVTVEPRIWGGEGEQPEGTITHDQMTDAEHNAIVEFALSGVMALAPFRDGGSGDSPAPDGGEIRPEAEPVDGDS